MSFLRREQGVVCKASRYPGMQLLGEGPRRTPCPQGCTSQAGVKMVEGVRGMGNTRGKGPAAKWASLAVFPAWTGLGPVECFPGTGRAMLADLGVQSSPGPVRGMGQMFGGRAASSPRGQSHPAPGWCSVAVAGLFTPVRSRLVLFVSTAHCSTVRLGFSPCAFIKAELYLLFNPPGSPVRCFCSFSYPALIFSP